MDITILYLIIFSLYSQSCIYKPKKVRRKVRRTNVSRYEYSYNIVILVHNITIKTHPYQAKKYFWQKYFYKYLENYRQAVVIYS